MNRSFGFETDSFEFDFESEADARPGCDPSAAAFRPVAVETPGGGRVRDLRPPSPADLVTIAGHRGRRIQLHRLAAAAWRSLVNAARCAGFPAPLLLPASGYRDPRRQAELWRAALQRYGSPKEARKWVAPPGTSAHQTGRAIDFFLGGRNSSRNVENLRRLPVYAWLAANASRFGFYPYPREPWHWEYNPPSQGRFELYPTSYETLEAEGEYEDE